MAKDIAGKVVIVTGAATLPFLILVAVIFIYGLRLGLFLLIRETKNAAYRKTLASAGGDKKMPFPVLFSMWLMNAGLFLMQTSPMYYRLQNVSRELVTNESVFLWIGVCISALGLIIETVADAQQWRFHSKKKALLKEGKPLSDLPAPYNKGFNTIGLWSRSRHPNYLGEQGIWASLYLFSVAAGIGIFNWSIIGALLLIVLFLGSSSFGEEISASKYPEYAAYQKRVSKFIPWRKYE